MIDAAIPWKKPNTEKTNKRIAVINDRKVFSSVMITQHFKIIELNFLISSRLRLPKLRPLRQSFQNERCIVPSIWIELRLKLGCYSSNFDHLTKLEETLRSFPYYS
uniref:Uncharacterized protein n=1 Tax=Romanomermis culicivorax TaxID=13658 RepID=A0A915KG55_ROMCU